MMSPIQLFALADAVAGMARAAYDDPNGKAASLLKLLNQK